MSAPAIDALLDAIGYPDRESGGGDSFMLRVDGIEVEASSRGGRVMLSHKLADGPEKSPLFAAYAAGRMLREDAVLAYIDGSLTLWQDAPDNAGPHGLARLFETFMDSCDWWRERTGETDGGSGDAADGQVMMIRP